MMMRMEFDDTRFADSYPPGMERHWWHVARIRVIAHAFTRHVARDARVIEVGCGTGIVTNALRERGWNVTGVDLGEPRHGLLATEHLMLGTDALDLPDELRRSFTTLVLFDVIEHVEDASSFLRSLLDAYPNVQQVVVTVPAGKELWTTFDDHYGHFRRYDRPLLREELDHAALQVEHIAYFFHGLYPAIRLNNTVRGRKREIRFLAPASDFSIRMHRVLGACCALEARLLPGWLQGTSIIAVARRR
jgi:SAM-dependent methyltransferase